MWVPNLLWQASHGWPVIALSADIAEEYGGLDGRIGLLVEAALMFSPVIFVAWVIGLVQLLRREECRRARLPAINFLVVSLGFLVTGGKGYYLAGAVVPLVAAGCTWLSLRFAARGLVVCGVAMAPSSMIAWPALLPVLPESTYADSSYNGQDEDLPETIGWPDYAAEVRQVVTDLPDSTIVFTGNYGEAGAFEWYGVGAPVYSGHNGWRNWGPPPDSRTAMSRCPPASRSARR